MPAHLQEACASLGYKAGDFPVTEAAAPRILSLPMFAELTEAQIDYVSGPSSHGETPDGQRNARNRSTNGLCVFAGSALTRDR